MPDKQDDTQNLSGTQPVNLPEWQPAPPTPPTPPPPMPTPPRTPTPVSGHVQQASQRYERRKRKRDDRDRSALYLPAWSVGLMLLLVFGITGAIVMLVITLGGQSAPGGQPRIVIITAQPSDTPNAQEAATATSPGIEAPPNFQGPQPTFGLEGPTLPPPPTGSPTPIQITINDIVIVNVDSLNIRADAGLNQKLVDTAVKGDRLKVLDGPKQADNLTWWKIQDTVDLTKMGWVAADYLDVAIQ
ncbi:MAG: SH3 domain-containing protein [Chloroflexi bacterium]|nr:SH3 domain-containing protein [Chloroflexota bacterium]